MNAMHILIRRAGKRMAVLKKYVLRSRAAALRRAGLLWRDASRWPAPTAIRKNLAPMAIALGGLLIAAGVFAFSGSNPENPVASRESPQWTQRTGAGLSVPACGSSSAGATCNNGAPVVDFIWTNTGDADESRICQSARIGTWVAGQDPGTAVRIGDNLPCSGSFTWTGASAATNYNYVIRYKTAAFCIASDEFSGRCLTWETRTYPREETRCLNQGESGCEEWETYTNFGHLISEDAFSTLACALPTADIKANGSDEPIMIPYNTSATASWSSTNANSCTVSPTGWTGTSGSQSTGNLTSSQTYSLACSNPNGSASDSVTVNVEIQPPLHITVFGRVFNETTGQGFGGASIETCRGFTVTTAANGNFSFQVPQKDGFCARVTPETRAGLDGPFLNNNPSVDPSFRTYEWQIAGWHCASQGGCSADQNTWDRSTDGTYDFKYREQGSPTVTCSANPSTINAGESTTWRATASGGSGAYSFSWSDTTGRTTPGGNGSSNPNSWGPFSYSSGAGASVIVLDSNNKQGTNSCTVTVNPVTPEITVFGRVFNETTGQGFGGASIETCRGFTVTTAANGNFSFQVPQKDGFCARVTPETRAGLDGPFLNNNPSVDPSFRTYEWQIAGWHCASQGGCSADQNTWDRSTDGTYDFKYREQGSPTVTCSANPSTINAGESTTWRATASGGSGAYSFSWSDTTGRTTPGGNGSSNPNSWGPFSYSSGAGASVIVLDSNNKQGTNSCTVTVNPLPPTGDLEIKRVDQNLDPLPDEATKAKATGSFPLGIKPENPAFYDDISIGAYRSEATELAGYTETYGTCDTPGCLVMSFSPATCSGGWCSAGDQTVSDGALRRVVFKYTPPDLTIASGPAANGSLVVGTPVTFSGTVRNQEGGANITDTFPNRFRADLNRDGSYETTMTPNPMIAGLAAGATSPAITSGSWTPSTAGDYRIELCADTPSGVVTESNEANNCATSNVTVTSPTSFQCSDTVDNTDPEDTIADYPNDVGCTSPTDNDERNRCVDGIDNDNDGTVDNEDSPYLSGRQDDPGCTSTQDNSEANPPTFKEIPPT